LERRQLWDYSEGGASAEWNGDGFKRTPVGYPMVNVRDIESGKVRVTRELFGVD
jgi:hypothetical protein